MSTSVYFINPSTDVPSYYGGDVFAASNLAPATMVADLATATVAALVPADIPVALCDESISRVNMDTPAEFVGITGKVTQARRMLELARAFRDRGKTVLIGGPFASLSPDEVRPHCDILVRGELEAVAAKLFADLKQGCWREEYDGGRPDLSSSPVPRWDLYPNERAVEGALQTGRGCPFECEFCDVIQYLGRRQRFKGLGQIRAELDELYRHGYRRVFLCDDNFTVARKRAKEVLSELRDWNRRHADSGGCAYHTQASIEAAEDEELLRLCAEAGLTTLFVGIETPNEDSLRETKKYQNLRRRLADSINHLIENGIAVRGGMMVGFDSDGPDIFERMFEFAMSIPVPIFNLGVLVAPAATPLFDRMKREGRLLPGGIEVPATPLDTNIIPRQMTREELLRGVRWLGYQLYRPAAFAHRVRHFVRRFAARRPPDGASTSRHQAPRPVSRDTIQLIKNLRTLGPEEDAMCKEIFGSLTGDSTTNHAVMEMMFSYVQVRHLYAQGHFWDPAAPPPATSPGALPSLPVLGT
jgi:radical SAM superfamily enzyme YgiQ (UPF0313 family)